MNYYRNNFFLNIFFQSYDCYISHVVDGLLYILLFSFLFSSFRRIGRRKGEERKGGMREREKKWVGGEVKESGDRNKERKNKKK